MDKGIWNQIRTVRVLQDQLMDRAADLRDALDSAAKRVGFTKMKRR